jgi:hypothetical protein
MPEKSIGVPSAKGLGGAFKDFGIGVAGGAAAGLAMRLFGGWGLLAAPLLAGSIVKGERGTIIACGFGALLGVALLGGLGGTSSAQTSQSVM